MLPKGVPNRKAARLAAGAGPASGFTLIEVLVVIAIIGILLAMLLPAVQVARESARRMYCGNQLRQVALAAHNYHSLHDCFPPGVDRSTSQRQSLFVFLLPSLEGGVLYQEWQRAGADRAALAATVLPVLVCPSDPIPQNPVQNRVSERWYGLASYAGNGGTRSFHPDSRDLKADGVFFEVGLYSRPARYQRAVPIAEIRDGTSQTLLFGERSHDDANYDSFAAQGWEQTMGEYGYWSGSGSNLAVGDVTLSSHAPVNYCVPFSYADRTAADPPANSRKNFRHYADLRLCAFGSNHPGGANFALADGSTRFISEDIPLETLRALSTREGHEAVSDP